jgi:hypothetical protein
MQSAIIEVEVPEHWRRRAEKVAAQRGESLSQFIRHLLEEGLPEPVPARAASTEENAAWDRLRARVRSRVSPGITPDEIEADITAASEEVRRGRVARGR